MIERVERVRQLVRQLDDLERQREEVDKQIAEVWGLLEDIVVGRPSTPAHEPPRSPGERLLAILRYHRDGVHYQALVQMLYGPDATPQATQRVKSMLTWLNKKKGLVETTGSGWWKIRRSHGEREAEGAAPAEAGAGRSGGDEEGRGDREPPGAGG